MVQPAAKLPLRPESLNVHTQENSILLGDDLCHPEKKSGRRAVAIGDVSERTINPPKQAPSCCFRNGRLPYHSRVSGGV